MFLLVNLLETLQFNVQHSTTRFDRERKVHSVAFSGDGSKAAVRKMPWLGPLHGLTFHGLTSSCPFFARSIDWMGTN